jgi:hypothetical protein
MDNFVTAKTYRPAAWTKPLPQPAERELRLAFPKVSGSRWSDRNTTRGVKENLLQRAWQAAAPYQARHGDQRMFPRTPMTAGKVPGTRISPVAALGGEGWSGRVFCHLSYKALPLDNDEVLGLMQPAGSLAIAGQSPNGLAAVRTRTRVWSTSSAHAS